MSQHQLDTNNFRSKFAQVLAGLSASLVSFNVGFIFGMPTIVIGALRNDDTALGLTGSQASWFGSLIFFAQPLGSVLSGISQDVLGRKKSLMIFNVPKLVAWVILYFATCVEHLFISVGLLGLSIGFLEAPLLSYIGETSQPSLRGVVGSFYHVSYNAGVMVISLLGVWLHWRSVVFCGIIGPVVTMLFMILIPESPPWLVNKGRIAEAEKAYRWLRGWVSPEAVKVELGALVDYVQQTHSTVEYSKVPKAEGTKTVQISKIWWRVLLEPEVLLAFRVIFIYFIVYACSNLFGLRPFFIEILDKIDAPLKSHVILAICGCLQMTGATCMGLCIRLLGKRGTTFLSLGLCIFCCLGLGFYFLLNLYLPWLPIVLFPMSYFCAAFGINGIPYLLVTELFPLRARGPGSGISTAVAYIALFLVTKTYYSLECMVSVSGTCLLYGMVGVLGFIYLYFELPETEGRTLEDIEKQLTARSHAVSKWF